MNKKNVSDLHLFLLWVRHDPTLLEKSAGKLLHCAVLIHIQDNNPPPCLPHLWENSLVHRTCWSPKQPAAHTEKSYSLNDSSPQVSCYFRSLSWKTPEADPGDGGQRDLVQESKERIDLGPLLLLRAVALVWHSDRDQHGQQEARDWVGAGLISDLLDLWNNLKPVF